MGYSTFPTIKHETEAVRRALHGEPVPALTFDAFRAANVARCLKWHPQGIESWSPSDWLTAVTGELGELASLLKMRNRERDGLPGNKFSPTQKQIADELADVLTYLDLLAEVLGVDLGRAAAEKFNEVSERVGFPDRIPVPARCTDEATLNPPAGIGCRYCYDADGGCASCKPATAGVGLPDSKTNGCEPPMGDTGIGGERCGDGVDVPRGGEQHE